MLIEEKPANFWGIAIAIVCWCFCCCDFLRCLDEHQTHLWPWPWMTSWICRFGFNTMELKTRCVGLLLLLVVVVDDGARGATRQHVSTRQDFSQGSVTGVLTEQHVGTFCLSRSCWCYDETFYFVTIQALHLLWILTGRLVNFTQRKESWSTGEENKFFHSKFVLIWFERCVNNK